MKMSQLLCFRLQFVTRIDRKQLELVAYVAFIYRTQFSLLTNSSATSSV